LQEIENQRRIEKERERKQLEIQKGIANENLKIGGMTQQQEFGSLNGRQLDPLHASVKALDEQHRYEHKYTEYERHQQDLEHQRLNQQLNRLRKVGAPNIPLEATHQAI
jgi:hypothetical protein